MPLATPTQWSAPVNAANAFSNCATSAPPMKAPAVEHGVDAGLDLVGDLAVLGVEVDERDDFEILDGVHVQVLGERRWFGTGAARRKRAGDPTHTSPGGMSWSTVLPMPTWEPAPIVTPSRTRQPAPR